MDESEDGRHWPWWAWLLIILFPIRLESAHGGYRPCSLGHSACWCGYWQDTSRLTRQHEPIGFHLCNLTSNL